MKIRTPPPIFAKFILLQLAGLMEVIQILSYINSIQVKNLSPEFVERHLER